MPVPDFQTIMLPLLQIVNDGEAQKTGEVVKRVGEHFNVTPDEMKELIPSGRAKLISNRVGWATTYLRKAGLLRSDKRGYIQVTDTGQIVVKENPKQINIKYLEKFPAFLEFRKKQKKDKPKSSNNSKPEADTPEQIIGEQIITINKSIEDDLLEQIFANTPEFFEQLVVDLVVKMGYGGSQADAGKAVGQTGDGGIDGTIKEDPLGLDIIYLQAKRWSNTVPIKEIRDFAGALLEKKARKGIFITTSYFPQSAKDYVNRIEQKIVLIDGTMLTSLMIEHEIGVFTKDVYRVKEVDSDYFES